MHFIGNFIPSFEIEFLTTKIIFEKKKHFEKYSNVNKYWTCEVQGMNLTTSALVGNSFWESSFPRSQNE
jgi:hypothetical protein